MSAQPVKKVLGKRMSFVRSEKGTLPHGELPTPPTDSEKYSYVKRHLYWLILPSIISMAGLTYSQFMFSIQSPVLWVYLIIVIGVLVYWGISLLVNAGTKDFDLEKHFEVVRKWKPKVYPSIDVMLPVCKEPLAVLRNAWTYISKLDWPIDKIKFYVLDDGAQEEVRALAAEFGFEYLSRSADPNKDRPIEQRGYLQKAGNMVFGFVRSTGDIIAVFDADFCPRSDYLRECAPYFTRQPKLGVLQTPQYFHVTKKQNWLERGAGAVQELFYRVVQVSRQQRGAAICVGTNALYRRAALQQNIHKLTPEGGPTPIGHSEDVHTGFDLRRRGWDLRYIPVLFATGICPSVRSAFLAQQYRWCMGSMSLLGSVKFRKHAVTMSLRGFFGYLSGFGYYISTAVLTIVGPMVPLVLLAFHPDLVLLENYAFILPSIIYTLVIFPLWHRHRYWLAAFATRMVYGWGHLFAIVDILRRKPKAWSPTGAKESSKKSTKVVLMKQFKLGIFLWGGGTALAWIGLAVFRMINGDWWDFLPVLMMGLLYGSIVVQCMQPGTPRAKSVNKRASAVKVVS